MSRPVALASATTVSQRAPSASVRLRSTVGRSAQVTMALARWLVESQSMKRRMRNRLTCASHVGVKVGWLSGSNPGRITRRFFTAFVPAPGSTAKRSAIVSPSAGKVKSRRVSLRAASYDAGPTVPEAAEVTVARPLKMTR